MGLKPISSFLFLTIILAGLAGAADVSPEEFRLLAYPGEEHQLYVNIENTESFEAEIVLDLTASDTVNIYARFPDGSTRKTFELDSHRDRTFTFDVSVDPGAEPGIYYVWADVISETRVKRRKCPDCPSGAPQYYIVTNTTNTTPQQNLTNTSLSGAQNVTINWSSDIRETNATNQTVFLPTYDPPAPKWEPTFVPPPTPTKPKEDWTWLWILIFVMLIAVPLVWKRHEIRDMYDDWKLERQKKHDGY